MTVWKVGPIGQRWVDAYAEASGDHNPVHRGNNAIVHGALLMALMERFVFESAGERQLEQLEARFLRPVAVGSQIVFTIGAGRTLEGGRQQMRIVAKTDQGLLCLIGDIILT